MNLRTYYDGFSQPTTNAFTINGVPKSTPSFEYMRGGTYDLYANSDVTYNSYPYIFYKWSNNSTLNDGYHYLICQGELAANYKGHLRTTEVSSLSPAPQVKSLKDTNGVLSLLYESMGGIFYTRSTNNGVTFIREEIVNSGENSFGGTNPSLCEIKGYGGSTVNSENNVAAVWQKNVGSNINIQYAERVYSFPPLISWFPVDEVTLTNVPSNFKCYPKLFMAKSPSGSQYLRVITYLRPAAGGATELVAFARSDRYNGQFQQYVVDAGNIPSYSVTGVYTSSGENSINLHFAYMKSGRLYYKHSRVILVLPRKSRHEVKSGLIN